MAMLRLPSDIQSLFCASTQIYSYKRVVEELVYNSLDAESISIAIRVNIEQDLIQVIDNGCGVSKYNFSLIGQRHATSKCVDLSTLKSIPNKYGYRGQSLASIIGVSQSVKITSRCHDSKETWIKSFYKGKEQKLCLGPQRPSKGTTIDIKGFLYNMKIQKKAIDSLNEFNDIKVFLEQLSLVHNNISLSLRDDTKNEIVFQMHKNRDIYQTLRSMFGIERTDLQELKVEKNTYKVSAFIGKKDNELGPKHWIYLNGKHLQSNKFQKIVNDNLIKSLKLNQQNRKKVKSNNSFDQEDDLHQKEIPFYFIFITCPYYDYDINQVLKQTVVEFKDWEPINKLIEKMATFYAGDINIKEVKPVKNQVLNKQNTDDTRNQVKKIMNKILGSNPRRIGISQMQNGIKGKITKRKPKKNRTKIQQLESKKDNTCNKITNRKEQVSLCGFQEEVIYKENKTSKEAKNIRSTMDSKFCTHNLKGKRNDAQKNKNLRQLNKAHYRNKDKLLQKGNKKIDIRRKQHESMKNKHKLSTDHNDKYPKNKLNKNNNLEKPTVNTKNLHKSKKVAKTIRNKIDKPKLKTNNMIQVFEEGSNSKNLQESKKRAKNIRNETDKPKLKINNFIKVFEEDPRGSVKKRCKILANKVDKLMSKTKNWKRKIFINETVQYSNVIKNNKNYSVRKKIGEIVIHNYIPKPPSFSSSTCDDRIWNKTKNKPYKSSYDLMQTILKTQETKNLCREAIDTGENGNYVSQKNFIDDILSSADYDNIFNSGHVDLMEDLSKTSLPPKLTFESHNYLNNSDQISHNYNLKNNTRENPNDKSLHLRFITKQSKDNFVIPKMYLRRNQKKSKNKLNKIELQNNNMHKFTKQLSHQEASYAIEFSKSNEMSVLNEKPTAIQNIDIRFNLNQIQKENDTHTMLRNQEIIEETNLEGGSTYTIDKLYCGNDRLCEDEENVDFIEDSTEKLVHGQFYQNNVRNENNKNSDDYPFDNHGNYKLCEEREHTDYIKDSTENAVQSQLHLDNLSTENENCNIESPNRQQIKMNVLFISKSQEIEKSNDIEIVPSRDQQINPLNICETVLSQDDSKEHNTNHTEWNDSLFNEEFDVDSFLCDRNLYNLRDFYESTDKNNMNVDDRSNFAGRNNNFVAVESKDFGISGTKKYIHTNALQNTLLHDENSVTMSKRGLQSKGNNIVMKDTNKFNFKNRLRFVPKGMSQLFTRCESRKVCDYNLEKDYYEEGIYNNFAQNVQLNCKVFEPTVQSVKELTTKAIDKVNYKLNKDNASLIFNGESLKQAKVLKQIDNKFIATKIAGKTHHSLEPAEYLVLFDQHAVHERIRLESNLSEYFDGNEWKSMPLEEVKLKVSKDEILYLHNHKNKFNQLGLRWTVLSNNEVAINAIPQAVLGKNPRQVEIVIKAVRNLIVEEINAIKSQSGCISLNPKAIMDLVFSEACRYAIKFGDHLSTIECEELLSSLSECKTPFQCAHGRPVMAVLMDIREDVKKYTINMNSVMKWKKTNKKHDKK